MKKNVRRKEATRRVNINGTGGGKANPDAELDSLEKYLLKMINQTTVYGMNIPERQVTFVGIQKCWIIVYALVFLLLELKIFSEFW